MADGTVVTARCSSGSLTHCRCHMGVARRQIEGFAKDPLRWKSIPWSE